MEDSNSQNPDWPAPRLSAPDPQTYTPRQREIHDSIASGPRGGVRGPLAIWLHRPELAARAQELGRYCRYDTSLDPRLSELAILTMARHWGAEYEWAAHKKEALKAGLSADVIEAIRTGTPPTYADTDEKIVHAVARSVLETRHVPDALYAQASRILGTERLVDLIGVLGYYTLISMTLNVFRIPPHNNEPAELS
ncbi:carboxymuconolactone decarboxylase family protein [Roseinatronobacter alkalisoli]|uniref:Carboxymuconolactone decarboxylase family protein n=1 Tax=Roseinatronobacter alkalisoli TaxID=3028235 RepID=A0ABT5TDT9_9RHOB|nr:carboxymuconolactone decarboxylase family protein [Roseinatronobacter sp. HJB301]MDD7973129.1 carboxymuconolactone decarboxylase family protein [Roseinatronobacter sp. HJB301]